MPVTRQHRYDDVTFFQHRTQCVDVEGADVVGEVTDLCLGLLNGPVPDSDFVPAFNKTAQAGDGRQAGAAPVNRHRSDPFNMSFVSCFCPAPDTAIQIGEGQQRRK